MIVIINGSSNGIAVMISAKCTRPQLGFASRYVFQSPSQIPSAYAEKSADIDIVIINKFDDRLSSALSDCVVIFHSDNEM